MGRTERTEATPGGEAKATGKAGTAEEGMATVELECVEICTTDLCGLQIVTAFHSHSEF